MFSPAMIKFVRLVAIALSVAACTSSPPVDPQAFLDLGITNASAKVDGVYCSGQPTEEQFAQLKSVGVARVVHLRAPIETGTGWEEAKAAELGIEFVRIPIGGAADLTPDNVSKLAAQLAGAKGPVLVSCASSNRVGAMMALKSKIVDGKSAADALQVGKDCGLTKLESEVTELLAK